MSHREHAAFSSQSPRNECGLGKCRMFRCIKGGHTLKIVPELQSSEQICINVSSGIHYLSHISEMKAGVTPVYSYENRKRMVLSALSGQNAKSF